MRISGRFIETVDLLSHNRAAPAAVALLGMIIALLFTFVLFPLFEGPFQLGFDSDGYGDLGRGIWEFGTFSYFPLNEPSIDRGPFYPYIISLLLRLTGGAFPYPIQLLQCLLSGITAFLTYWIGRRLYDERAGFLAGLACALNPLLFWYSPRIWVDVILIFQFTLLVAYLISYLDRPTILKAVLIGLIIGTGSLNKSILLPFALIIPIGLHLIGGKRVPCKQTIVMVVVALGVIAPWTLRNYNITGHLIPIHILPFYSIYQGDSPVKRFWQNPFSVNVLQKVDSAELDLMIGPLKNEFKNMTAWQIEYQLSNRLMDQSIRLYKNEPLFFIKKLAVNGYMFWFVAGDPWKTFAFSALMIPILIMFGRMMFLRLRTNGFRGIESLHLALTILYFGAHLPVVAYVRHSTALIPLLLAYGAGMFAKDRTFRGGNKDGEGPGKADSPGA